MRAKSLIAMRAQSLIARMAGSNIGILGAMTQVMIHKHQRYHGFGDGRGAQTDTGIMTALGHDFRLSPTFVDGFAGHRDA